MTNNMNFYFVDKLNDQAIDQLVMLYSNEFWCKNRNRQSVCTMLNNTDIIIGAMDNENNLVGFVRVLTDYIFKATIYDLIVQPKWRGNDLGLLLMNAVFEHPQLKQVEHFDLNCLPEMYPFYEKWGFTTDLQGLGFMRRFTKN